MKDQMGSICGVSVSRESILDFSREVYSFKISKRKRIVVVFTGEYTPVRNGGCEITIANWMKR